MKIPNLKVFTLIVIGSVIAFNSCQDDYSEKDFMADQERLMDKAAANELALLMQKYSNDSSILELQNAINKLNRDENQDLLQSVGAVITYDVVVADLDDRPIPGVTVVIGNQAAIAAPAGGRTNAAASAETDANGIASFANIVVGGNSVELSKEGYVSANAAIYINPDLNFEYNWNDGLVLIPPRYERSVFPLMSNSTGNVATISGRVTGETDVTNDMEENLEGIVIAVDLKDFLEVEDNESSDVEVLAYSVDGGDGFGAATTDAEGMYTLQVPATVSGSNIELIYPNIVGEQTVAYNEMNGQMIDPMVGPIATSWGPTHTYSSIPDIPGAKAVFPAPDYGENAGEGFKFKFTPIPSKLALRSWSNIQVGNTAYWSQYAPCYDGDTLWANWRINVLSLGSGYNVSPVATLTGGDGSGAELFTSLRTRLASITVTDQGTGYGDQQPVTIGITYDYTTLDGTATFESGTVVSWDITSNADGTIPSAITVPEAEQYLFNTTWRVIGWNVNITGLGTNAAATATTNGRLYGMNLYDGGFGYTSEPTIELTGNAMLSFEYVNIAFEMDVDNSGVTSPYAWAPVISDFRLFARRDDQKEEVKGMHVMYETEPLNNCEIVNGSDIFNESTLNGRLTVDSNGNVVWKDATVQYITGRSSMEPQVIFEESLQPMTAMATVNINSDGEVTGLSVPGSGITNPITGFDVNWGVGYSAPFGVTIETTIVGISGSGAVANLDGKGYFVSPDYYQWNSVNNIMVNRGSGYVQNVNQAGKKNFNGNNTLNVQAGGTYINNIEYGTGQHQEDIGTN